MNRGVHSSPAMHKVEGKTHIFFGEIEDNIWNALVLGPGGEKDKNNSVQLVLYEVKLF